jgi:hypothetical protein
LDLAFNGALALAGFVTSVLAKRHGVALPLFPTSVLVALVATLFRLWILHQVNFFPPLHLKA